MENYTYVYILQSDTDPERFYVGASNDLKARLARHNSGQVSYTAKYLPWKIKTAIAFATAEKAFAFERYLKTASGRAFSKKHF